VDAIKLSVKLLDHPGFFLFFPNNQTQGRIVRYEGPEPVKRQRKLVSESGNRNQVNKQPNQPCKQSLKESIWQVDHGFVLRNDRHTSFVMISKGFQTLIFGHPFQVLTKQIALLDSYLR